MTSAADDLLTKARAVEVPDRPCGPALAVPEPDRQDGARTQAAVALSDDDLARHL